MLGEHVACSFTLVTNQTLLVIWQSISLCTPTGQALYDNVSVRLSKGYLNCSNGTLQSRRKQLLRNTSRSQRFEAAQPSAGKVPMGMHVPGQPSCKSYLQALLASSWMQTLLYIYRRTPSTKPNKLYVTRHAWLATQLTAVHSAIWQRLDPSCIGCLLEASTCLE